MLALKLSNSRVAFIFCWSFYKMSFNGINQHAGGREWDTGGVCCKKYLPNIANARSVGKIINLIPNYNSCAFIKLCQIKAQKLSVICDSRKQFQPNFVIIEWL